MRTRRRGSDGRRAVSLSNDEILDSKTRWMFTPRNRRRPDAASLAYCTLRERCSASNVR